MLFTEVGSAQSLTRFARRLAFVAAALAPACSVEVGQNGDGGSVAGDAGIGQVCASDSECRSGVCHGTCCAAPCNSDVGHPECTSCDSAGACNYPQVQCAAATCDPATLVASTAAVCSNGVCPAPLTLHCAASCAGTTCGAGCRGDQDCSLGTRCVVVADGGGLPVANPVGICLSQGLGGAPCVTADACQSGVCLGGTCCNAACSGLDPNHRECTTCDATGACVYPAVLCSPSVCDSVANTFSGGSVCNAGSCPTPALSRCGANRCGPTGCASGCLTDADCAASGFCVQDQGAGRCCPVLVDGSTLYVDLVSGSDASCCGLTPTSPCQTLARAVAVADFSRSKGAQIGLSLLTHYTLSLSVDGGGGDWQLPPAGVTGDVFPFDVPRGVVVHAPGVNLGALDLQDSPDDSRYPGSYAATLEGAPGRPLVLGLNRLNQVTGPVTIATGTVNLSNVLLFGGLTNQGTLNLGLDSQGAIGGTVQFGWPADAGSLNGSLFIPAAAGLRSGGVLIDHGNPDDSVLRMFGRGEVLGLTFAMQVGGDVTLTHHPLLTGGGGGIASFGPRLQLSHASLTNLAGIGLYVTAGTALVDSSTIEGNGCEGILVGDSYLFDGVNGGKLFLSNSTVTGNSVGVKLGGTEVDSSATPTVEGALVDLRFAPDGGPGNTQVYCNGGPSHPAPSFCLWTQNYDGGVGADVWNSSQNQVFADGVAWGPTLPTLWTCDEGLGATSCASGSEAFCDGGYFFLVDDAGVDAGELDAGPVVCHTFAPEAVSTPDAISGVRGALSIGSPTLAVTSCP